MSRYYYEDEDELDVHITRQRSRSPAPQFFGEVPPYRHTRPPYLESQSYGGRAYERPPGAFLIPAGGRIRRSHSQGRRSPSPMYSPPLPQPVIINNKIYNDRDEEDDYYHHQQLSPFHPQRPRATSFNAPPRKEDYELEVARKQLAAYKLEEDKAAERKRVAKELELERLRKEKEEEEEEEKLKAERKKAIEKYKTDEIERIAKEKKAKEEAERNYKERLAADLRKSGMDEKQIARVLKGEIARPPPPKEARPIYTRMSRRHLSIETLNKFRVDYEFDHDPGYILIKRTVPEYEQDFWWTHTREVRERRHTLLTIEGKKDKHKHHGHDEVEFEFIRKKKHERKPSPSPLLTFLAGGKR